jgi:HAD superfamily hydrolase (TIGR01509 family)
MIINSIDFYFFMKAIFFDLDGVLINSIDAWFYAFNETLKHFGLGGISESEFKESYWGHELPENLRKLGLQERAEKYCEARYSKFIDKIKLFEDSKRVLERAKKFKIALVTNTPKVSVHRILKRFGLAKYFDAVVTGDDVKRGKPSPEPVIKACKLLKVEPKDTILVGDTQSDVKAGRSAGCKVIGLGLDADARIEKLADLLNLVSL